jgi:hypothetical protein
LGRIEGVEKPALLLGIGLLLYRVWRNEERRSDFKSRWQGAIDRVRKRFGDGSQTPAAQATESKPPPVLPS